MYNKLFDVLFSTDISEDVKVLIAENYPTQLNEGISEDSCYVEFLKTMIDTNISEASLEEVIDEVFGGLSEEQIEALTEEFIHSIVNQYLNEGLFDARPIGLTGLKKEIEKSNKTQTRRVANSKPIGLSGIKRREEAKDSVKSEPKGPSVGDKVKSTVSTVAGKAKEAGSAALGKLKSAVGKVREWTKKMAGEDKPVGISKLKADQTARINRAVNMGTYKKAEEPKAEEVKTTPEVSKEPVKSERVEKAKEKAKGTTLPSGDTIEMDNSSIKRRKKAEEKAKGTTLPAGEKPIELGAKTYSFKELKNDEKKEAPVKATKKSTIKTTKKVTTKSSKKTAPKESAKNIEDKTSKEVQTETTKKKRGRPRKTVTANEAWDEVINLLKSSTISEETLKEITEMKSNAILAKKAVERAKDEFNQSMKPLEIAVGNKLPVSDKSITNAGDKAARFEKIKTAAEKKYGLKF